MAAPKTPTSKDSRGFDVVCVVGRVSLSDSGDTPPEVAAMTLIAEHNAPGEYSYPNRNGGITRVTVDFD